MNEQTDQSIPLQDQKVGHEEEINRGRLFRIFFQRLRYMYQAHVGLKYDT